jgi:hypothetical protein
MAEIGIALGMLGGRTLETPEGSSTKSNAAALNGNAGTIPCSQGVQALTGTVPNLVGSWWGDHGLLSLRLTDSLPTLRRTTAT